MGWHGVVPAYCGHGMVGYGRAYPLLKGPSTQIVGFQGPKTIRSMDFGTENPTIWVFGPSGYIP